MCGTDMSVTGRKRDLLVFLTSAPHQADTVTTALRITGTALGRGATVHVWACGYATLLTQRSLGEVKPVNLRDRHRAYPTTAALVQCLLTTHQSALTWDACRFCSEERGALAHIDPVRMRSALRLGEVVRSCSKTLYLGGA